MSVLCAHICIRYMWCPWRSGTGAALRCWESKLDPLRAVPSDTEHQDVAGQLENQQMAAVEASTGPLQLCVAHTERVRQWKAGLRLPSNLSD